MLMTIGEFERATGLKRSTIRVYENHGLLSPGTARNSYRLYGRDDLEAVEAIKLGKALGFTLREIRSLTEAWYGGRLSTAQKASAIAHKLAECREKRAQLEALIAYLEASLDWLESGEKGPKPGFGGV